MQFDENKLKQLEEILQQAEARPLTREEIELWRALRQSYDQLVEIVHDNDRLREQYVTGGAGDQGLPKQPQLSQGG